MMKFIAWWSKVRPWEIALFFIWCVAAGGLGTYIGGVPYDRVDADGMYLVKLTGRFTPKLIEPWLYWTWNIMAYGFGAYAVFFFLKYGKYLSLREHK